LGEGGKKGENDISICLPSRHLVAEPYYTHTRRHNVYVIKSSVRLTVSGARNEFHNADDDNNNNNNTRNRTRYKTRSPHVQLVTTVTSLGTP